MRLLLASLLLALHACAGAPALAHDGKHADASDAMRRWYETRELTPEAQKRFGFKSCCSKADVVKTQFRVNRRDNGDEWFWMKDGKWDRVPADIIHWNEHAPDGQATLFAVTGRPVCFYPPGSGI